MSFSTRLVRYVLLSSAKAVSVGAKTVNSLFSLLSVSARSAAVTAATSVSKFPFSIAVSTMFFISSSGVSSTQPDMAVKSRLAHKSGMSIFFMVPSSHFSYIYYRKFIVILIL